MLPPPPVPEAHNVASLSSSPGGFGSYSAGDGAHAAHQPRPNAASPPASTFFRDQENDWRRHSASLSFCLKRMQEASAAAEDVEAGTEACEGADISLRQMEAEARTAPNSQALLQLVRKYRAEFEEARCAFTRLVQQWQRQQLLQGAGLHTRKACSVDFAPSSSAPAAAHREGFAFAEDEEALVIHHAGGKLLSDSNRLAVESEHVGLAVMGQLRSQRESILTSRSLAQKTYGELQHSRSLLTAMLRRSLFSKTVLAAIIVFLSLAIICVLIDRLLRLLRAA
ncbi:hypothetical protein BESB_045950 [Besnoitia besnoiti]|uniref:Transmembrane protein n=1 Tax=Besnoitia besnoiti TaxID=94643 RepID=A0A2A9ML42_BESBE|nr:hypothetical protein BESB_045950 [Besnoitia besnoiti]PFH36403.1 hypothetical protein BESB_045950 [Besnoitia besnoiti]